MDSAVGLECDIAVSTVERKATKMALVVNSMETFSNDVMPPPLPTFTLIVVLATISTVPMGID